MNNKSYKKFILPGVFIVLSLVLGVVILSRNSKVEDPVREPAANEIRVQRDGRQVYIANDGIVEYSSGQQRFFQKWQAPDGTTLYELIKNKLATASKTDNGGYKVTYIDENGNTQIVYIDDDEDIDQVFDEFDGNNSSEPSPTVAPTASSPPIIPTSPVPSSSSPPSDCPFWLLGFCVYPFDPSPTPAATAEVDIRPADCESNSESGRVVISNELCISTPTPAP